MQQHQRFISFVSWIVLVLVGCGGGVVDVVGPMGGSPGAGGDHAFDVDSGSRRSGGGRAGVPGGGGTGNAGDTTGSVDALVQPANSDASSDTTMDVAMTRDGGALAGDGASSASYVCSLVLGIATTGGWFNGGFEKVVDNARWEIKNQDSAHLEKWADPASPLWALPTNSACTQNADRPDRIVFMGVNYDYTTVDQFLPKYLAVVNNIKTKYPTVRRVDVMTYTRGPGNVECIGASRSNDSYIKPAQDEAIKLLAAMYPDFVFPAPQWEVQSCSDFTLCPHLTGQANALIAKTIGAYFLVN